MIHFGSHLQTSCHQLQPSEILPEENTILKVTELGYSPPEQHWYSVSSCSSLNVCSYVRTENTRECGGGDQFYQSFDDDDEMLLRGTFISDLDMKSNEKHIQRNGEENVTQGTQKKDNNAPGVAKSGRDGNPSNKQSNSPCKDF